MKFDTKVWHPNICSKSGTICLFELSSGGWSPAFSITKMLQILIQRLIDIMPHDPQDQKVAY